MKNAQVLSAQNALDQTRGCVLLINPPVFDTRYEWIKWNQPLDLLKLSTLLKKVCECQVKLFDFLLPNPSGMVPRRQSRIETNKLPDEQVFWHFGQSWETFDSYLDKLVNNNWIPDSVWIYTLTSFWWQLIPLIADRVKNKLKSPNIVLYGNYPTLETQHASCYCPNVDIVVNDYINLTTYFADFSLYEDHKPRFYAIDLYSIDPLEEISNAIELEYSHFTFFNENIFLDFDSYLKPILNEVVMKGWDIRFHGICGVLTRDFPIGQANLLAKAHFSELHFEQINKTDGIIDESLYRTVMDDCEHAGFLYRSGLGWESDHHFLSGFLWIDRPDDDMEILVYNALKLLQLIGMVIPKPYSPLPGSPEYYLLITEDELLEPEEISPHRLPFTRINKIDKDEYRDLYRMTAFLNKKVRGKTFDFLGDSYLAQVIRDSLNEKKWDISTRDNYGQ